MMSIVRCHLDGLSKHSEIEFEGLGFINPDLAKVGVLGGEQNIPLAANRGGGHTQCNRLPTADPEIADGSQRIVSQFVPLAGKGMQVEPLAGEALWNLRLN